MSTSSEQLTPKRVQAILEMMELPAGEEAINIDSGWNADLLPMLFECSEETLKKALELGDFPEQLLGQIVTSIAALHERLNKEAAETPAVVEMLVQHHTPQLADLFREILEGNGSELGSMVIHQALERAMAEANVATLAKNNKKKKKA